MISILRRAVFAAALLAALPVHAQDRDIPDRSDPGVIRGEREEREAPVRREPRLRVPTPQAEPTTAPGEEVVAGAIRVVGATRIPTAAFAQAIEPYLGRPLEQADLVRLATDIAGVLRRSGYGLATAWVPAQDMVGGILTVQVDEGRIDEIRASGPAADLVEQRLSGLTGSQPVRTDRLERQLLLAGDLAGLWVGDARLVREGGRNILTVETRYDRLRGQVRIDNWGTRSVGPLRAWGEVEANGVAARGDSLLVGAATTPLDPGEFQLVEARYRVPVGPGGTMIGFGGYVGRTRSDSETNDDLAGDSSEFEVEASQPLTRSRDASVWLTGRLELRDSRLDRGGIPLREDRIVSATASLYGSGKLAGGRLRGRLSLVQGLDLLGATRRGDPLASRANAGGVFTKLEAWAEYVRPLGGGFSLELATRSQVADGPLLSGEEMGLGGPQFLRAFDYRERSGDEGVAASGELRFDLKDFAGRADKVQLYGYADGGRIRNLGITSRSRGTLASAGLGARITLDRRWEAGLELGVPLTDGAEDQNPRPRFSFSLTRRF